MAKDTKPSEKSPERYEDVVQRLDEVVKKLEGGQLPLEDSLKAFEEGVRLVQRGEKLLGDAEKRIEELLAGEGEDGVVAAQPGPSAGGHAPRGASKAKARPSDEEDDVPF